MSTTITSLSKDFGEVNYLDYFFLPGSDGFGDASTYTRIDRDGNRLVFTGHFEYDANGNLTDALTALGKIYLVGTDKVVGTIGGQFDEFYLTRPDFLNYQSPVIFKGSKGDDVMTGHGTSSATFNGLGGNDYYTASPDNDKIDGGTGSDTLDLTWQDASNNPSGFTELELDLNNPSRQFIYSTFTGPFRAYYITVASIENVFGGNENDQVVMTDDASEFYGNGGFDYAEGHGGNDTLHGGTSSDALFGDDGDDLLYGDSEYDNLTGGAGNDSVYGGFGDDIVAGNAGNDLLDGGDGLDVARFFATRGPLVIDLRKAGPQNLGAEGKDTFVSIENLDGGKGNDKFTGTDGANRLDGAAGNDTLIGGDGNDTLLGRDGDDVLDGGAGIDVADYASATKRVVVDLSQRGAQDTKGAGVDILSGIERLVGGQSDDVLTGGRAADVLQGGEGADRLTGGSGADTLDGGNGNDTIVGGKDHDVLVGNTGNDVFEFASAADADIDAIVDFNLNGDDVIDLSKIDAHPGGSDDAFSLVGGYSGAGGEVIIVRPGQPGVPSQAFIVGDIDGDKATDFTIIISTSLFAPTSADLIL